MSLENLSMTLELFVQRVRASIKAQKYSNARQRVEFSRRKITPTPGKEL